MNLPLAIERLRSVLRRQHKAPSTESNYIDWLRHYVNSLGRLPDCLSSEQKLERFLTGLACHRDLSASSQNQALNAILFFYKEVLRQPLQGIDALRAKRPIHLRHAPTVAETRALLQTVRDIAGYVSPLPPAMTLHREKVSKLELSILWSASRMNSLREQFLNLKTAPARLSAEEVAWWLGFSAHDIPILVSQGLLKPLGHPPVTGAKFFAAEEVAELRRDLKWLARASDCIVEHWKQKNQKKTAHRKPPSDAPPYRGLLKSREHDSVAPVADFAPSGQ
jgi:hypothetical protein